MYDHFFVFSAGICHTPRSTPSTPPPERPSDICVGRARAAWRQEFPELPVQRGFRLTVKSWRESWLIRGRPLSFRDTRGGAKSRSSHRGANDEPLAARLAASREQQDG